MKQTVTLFLAIILPLLALSQSTRLQHGTTGILASTNTKSVNGLHPQTESYRKHRSNDKYCVTIGVLQGGGSLVGADLEGMVSERLGLQAGLGFIGFGAGLNIHVKPRINSSAVSIQYWHQGLEETHTLSLAGATYIFRARKVFTAQLGFGVVLDEGPGLPDDYVSIPGMLMYSIGIYLPF